MKDINIILVDYPDLFSKFFRIIFNCKYTHASIGITEDDQVFYSYVTKGFRTEYPQKHPRFRNKEVPCCLYKLQVTDAEYEEAQVIIKQHIHNSTQTKYSLIGMFFCALNIKYEKKDRYFCSQFVSSILEKIKVVKLKKHSSLFLPDDFLHVKELQLLFKGKLSELII